MCYVAINKFSPPVTQDVILIATGVWERAGFSRDRLSESEAPPTATPNRLRYHSGMSWRSIALVAVAATALLFGACVSSNQDSVTNEPPLHERHPEVFMLASYDFDGGSSLADRIVDAPDFVIAYLEEMDGNAYRRHDLSADDRKNLEEVLAILPPRMDRVFRDRLIGVYVLDESFVGGGLTECILSDDGEPYAIIVLNARTLALNLSDWITYRENTAFQPLPRDIRIVAECGNDVIGATHILLHEGVHVVDYVEGLTPYLQNSMMQLGWEGTPPGDDYGRGVWKEFATPKRRYDLPDRRSITYYGLHNGPHLERDRAVDLYAALEQSPFPSLYGATTVIEDLAETVAWHHLTEILGQSNRLTVEFDNGEKRSFEFQAESVTEARAQIVASFYE